MGQVTRHAEETFIVAVGKVGIGVAVVVDIHQTGDHAFAAQIHAVLIGYGGEDLTEAAVFHIEAAVDEAVATENVSILKKLKNQLLTVLYPFVIICMST